MTRRVLILEILLVLITKVYIRQGEECRLSEEIQ